jgi:hypothetical protein
MTINQMHRRAAQLFVKIERHLLRPVGQEGRAGLANHGLTQGGREQ